MTNGKQRRIAKAQVRAARRSVWAHDPQAGSRGGPNRHARRHPAPVQAPEAPAEEAS